MCRVFALGLLLFAWQAPGLRADDIDVYRREGLAADHLLLGIDLDSASAVPACDTLAACRPPYLSAGAFQQLEKQRAGDPGRSVSRLEVALAVVASVLSRPRFDAIRVALLVRQGAGAELLLPFETLGEARGPLEAALWALPERLQPEVLPEGSPLAIYLEWLRLTRAGEMPAPEGACPRLYSVLLSHATPQRWADLDSSVKEYAPALPSPSLASAAALLRYLHDDQVDLFETVPYPQYLVQSWFGMMGGELPSPAAATGSEAPYNSLPLQDPRVLEHHLSGLMQEASPRALTLAEPGILTPAPQQPGQVFLPLFANPDQAGWPGNLKKLGLLTPGRSDRGHGTTGYLDALGHTALEPNGPFRGQLSQDALTLWTDAEALPEGAQGVDGDRILLGGAGQLMAFGLASRDSAAGGRELYLEPPVVANGTENRLIPLNADEFTLSSAPYLREEFAAADTGAALSWLRWLRGEDVDDEDGDGDTTELRDWLLGALVHSRPAVINYGARSGHRADNPLVRVYVGSNAGVLHAFDNTTARGEESGRERFGFIPRAMLAVQRARREQGITASGADSYGVDGSPVPVLRDLNGDGQIVADDGDQALLVFGLRRGGTHYYALDVSDPDTAPILRWEVHADPAGDFAELGLGFAEPVVGRVRFSGEPRDVVVLAGGYHGGRDAAGLPIGKDAGSNGDPVGNAIFVVDAQSGELLWKAVRGDGLASDDRFEHPGLSDSFPSAPAALRDSSGLIYRLYLGDSGGAVWRVDLPPGDTPNHRAQHWSLSKFAQLDGEASEDDRRFFHPPDLVRSRDAEGRPFDGVLIASGNRAAAADTGVRDGLFYLRDYAIEAGPPEPRQPEPLTFAGLVDRSNCDPAVGAGCDASGVRGWRLMFPGTGEKGLSTPLTEAGEVFFTTFVPPTALERCSGGIGHSLLYRINLEDGSAVEEGGTASAVGEGLSHGVIAVGEALLLPGSGLPADEEDSGNPARKLIPQQGRTLFQLYWREPGRDDL